MSLPTARHAIILLAHGSRDPLWKTPIEAVARQIAELSPDVPVCCAYLEATSPDLAGSVAKLAALGVATVRVVPLFLGMGKHTREDLPQLMASVRRTYPQIAFDLRPSLGEEPGVIELVARIALS